MACGADQGSASSSSFIGTLHHVRQLVPHAQIPAGIRIPRGTVVAADATPEYFLRAAPLPAALAKKKDASP